MMEIYDKYLEDIPNLLILIGETTYAFKKIGIPNQEKYKELIDKYEKRLKYAEGPQYYSFDGQKFFTMEEAAQRNALLQEALAKVSPENTSSGRQAS